MQSPQARLAGTRHADLIIYTPHFVGTTEDDDPASVDGVTVTLTSPT